MRAEEREIQALLKLLNDNDERVLEPIKLQLMSYGESVIAALEQAWTNSEDPEYQHKVLDIVHQIQFNEVKTSLLIWHQSGATDLLEGALLVNKYQYPALDVQWIRNQISEIRRAVWMEMYYTMNAYDKTKLLNHIFFVKHGFHPNVKNHSAPENSYLSQVLESKKGNQISLAILYSVIAQQLEIPIYGVNLPQHFVLCYKEEGEVLFYINPFNKGQIFGKFDIDQFLKQIDLERLPQFYEPCSHSSIILRVLRNLHSAYEKLGNAEKAQEIKSLMHIFTADSK